MHPLVLLVASVALAAQHRSTPVDTLPVNSSSATIVGIVTDSLGHAIGGADVLVDGIRMAPTDSFGSFILRVAPNRRHLIQLRALGFIPGQFSIAADSGETRTAEIPLRSVPNLLAPVTVMARLRAADRNDPGVRGFARRRETLGGTFFDAAEIKRYGYPPLSMLLRRVPGATVSSSVVNGITHTSVQMRGTPTIGHCPVQVFLDGRPMTLSGGQDDIDTYINTHELAAVEVYPATSWVPVQFMGPTAACGTVVLWSDDTAVH